MKNHMKYKDYFGSVNFDEDEKIFYGKVEFIKSLISYEGKSAGTLIKSFHDAVDDYLNTCKEKNIEPEKSFRGTFNIRIKPSLHKDIAVYAKQEEKNLNQVVSEALELFIEMNKS